MGQVAAIKGLRLAAVAAGVRYANRLDLVLIEIPENASVSAVFTQNAFCAAPVQLCRQHLSEAAPRYLLINTGNANAGTGEAGLNDALIVCQSLADLSRQPIQAILPFSTGVIGERLPVDPIRQGLPKVFSALSEQGWEQAAQGILTTDTRPKLRSRTVRLATGELHITGMAKGAGMIKPNMATMLAFIATDAALSPDFVNTALNHCVQHSFNRITVDGDTSTNDACVLIATGSSGIKPELSEADCELFLSELNGLFVELATDLIRDAEGASKFLTITVRGGKNEQDCLKVAYAVAESPLVKTALFASDANWGRVLAAIGRAGVDALAINRVAIDLGHLALVRDGSVAPDYRDEDGQQVMAKDEVALMIDLGMTGDNRPAEVTVWTSDLSLDYVRINADYRS